MAMQRGILYVITGPVFDNSEDRLNERVLIPKKLFKAVYDPALKQAGVYITNNAPGWDYRIISINELTKIIGVDVFPTLSNSSKDYIMELPTPSRNAKKLDH